MKLVVFTPCLNEESTLKEFFRRIPKKIDGITEIKLLMVDDGSSDSSVSIARKLGVEVLENKTRKKLAYSHMRGIKRALELGADITVSIDADLQFFPESITQLVKPIVNGSADFVSADRFTDPETGKKRKPENMPPAKYLGNLLGAWLVGSITGSKFPDVTCGFRAYSRLAMLSLNINGKNTYTQESFLVLAAKKLNIAFVPMIVLYFKDRKSRMVSSIFQYISQSGLTIITSFRDYAPLKFFGSLGFIPFIFGAISGIFVLMHWIQTGQFTPYKYLGFAAIYAVSASLIIWLIGFLADMLDRMLNNQEKILLELKELKYRNNHK